MAKTDALNSAIPPDTGRSPALGAGDIRTIVRAVIEILAKDHYTGASSPYSEDAAGEHAKITLRQTTKPGFVADKGFVYTKDVSGTTELFYEDEAGNEIQLTDAGKIRQRSSDCKLANNTPLTALNASGTSTVDMVKIGTDNLPVVGDGCKAAAATEAGDGALTLMTKGYIEAKIAADIAAAPLATIYDSGWFAVSNDTSYVKAHGLTSTPLMVSILAADSGTPTTWYFANKADSDGHYDRGYNAKVDATNVSLHTFASYRGYESDIKNWAYARIIALA
jgi:hypothetical protein